MKNNIILLIIFLIISEACPPSSLPGCGNGSSMTESGLTSEMKKVLLDHHNNYRELVASGSENRGGGQPSSSNMEKMVWDEDIEALAQSHAESCSFGHSTSQARDGAGENIAYAGGGGYTINQERLEMLTDLWYDEVDQFSSSMIDPFQFSGGTGHYTQMLWAKSNRLGCGAVAYSGGYGTNVYLVCQYKIAGNMMSGQMYALGNQCSSCPSGKSCDSRFPALCHDGADNGITSCSGEDVPQDDGGNGGGGGGGNETETEETEGGNGGGNTEPEESEEEENTNRPECIQNIKDIDDAVIDASLETVNEEGTIYYDITIMVDNYTLDETCLDQELMIGNEEITDYTYENDEIMFRINTENMGMYGCTQEGGNNLSCEISWNIYYQELIQHSHTFMLVSNLVTSETTITIGHSESSSVDLGNPLNIDTLVTFCDNIDCDNEISNTEYMRGEDIYFKVEITSNAYMNYYLQHLAVAVGSYDVEPVEVNEDTVACVKYHIQVDIAVGESSMVVTTKLNGTARRRRMMIDGGVYMVSSRHLSEVDMDNYGLRERQGITILDPVEEQQEQEKEARDSSQDNDDSGMKIALVAVSSVVGVLAAAGLGFVGFKVYSSRARKSQQLNQQSKYEEKPGSELQGQTPVISAQNIENQ